MANHKGHQYVRREPYPDPRLFVPPSQFNETNFTDEMEQSIVCYSTDLKIQVQPSLRDFTVFPMFTNVFRNFGYQRPTPIQALAIPYLIETNLNLSICSKPGSGKTLAYLLPILDYIHRVKQLEKYAKRTRYSQRKPYAVIVVPTSLLALEFVSLIKLLAKNDVSIGYGLACSREADEDTEIQNNGCDIYVGIIGRVQRSFQNLLSKDNLRFIVLDDLDCSGYKVAHGIFQEVLKACRVILANSDLMKPRISADLLGPRCILISFKNPWNMSNIQQSIQIMEAAQKDRALLKFFMDGENTRKVLLFVKKSDIAGHLHRMLTGKVIQTQGSTNNNLADQLFLVLEDVTNNKSSSYESLLSFREGVCTCLIVVGDRLCKGLNIPNVQTVINYDCPETADEYVRKVGRCGRAHNPGRSITYFDPDHDHSYATYLMQVLEASDQREEADLLEPYV